MEESRRMMFDMHRDSVIWYLGRKLEEAGEVQRGMMERRLEREVERGRSVLYKVSGEMGHSEERGLNGHVGEGSAGGVDGSKRRGMGLAVEEDESKKEIEQQLSPEQLQLFAKENQDMLKHYEDTLDQVRFVQSFYLVACQFTDLVHATEQQSGQCSRYRNSRQPLYRIWISKLQTFHNLSLTHYLRVRTSGVAIRN